MPRSTRPKLDRPMRKDIAKYYAQMMYSDDQRKFNNQLQEYQKKLIAQSLENIKERVFHVCPYCNERQEFPGDGHREETINNKFYWIQNCPSCNREVYCNIFTVRTTDQIGQPDYYVNSRWMTKEMAFSVQEPKLNIGIGIGKQLQR